MIFLLSGGAASVAYFKEVLDVYLDIDCPNNSDDNDNNNDYYYDDSENNYCTALLKIFASQISAAVSSHMA